MDVLPLDYETRQPPGPLPKWLPVVGLYAISFGLAGLIYHEAETLPHITVCDDPREHIWGIPVEPRPAEMYNPGQERAERMGSSADD